MHRRPRDSGPRPHCAGAAQRAAHQHPCHTTAACIPRPLRPKCRRRPSGDVRTRPGELSTHTLANSCPLPHLAAPHHLQALLSQQVVVLGRLRLLLVQQLQHPLLQRQPHPAGGAAAARPAAGEAQVAVVDVVHRAVSQLAAAVAAAVLGRPAFVPPCSLPPPRRPLRLVGAIAKDAGGAQQRAVVGQLEVPEQLQDPALHARALHACLRLEQQRCLPSRLPCVNVNKWHARCAVVRWLAGAPCTPFRQGGRIVLFGGRWSPCSTSVGGHSSAGQLWSCVRAAACSSCWAVRVENEERAALVVVRVPCLAYSTPATLLRTPLPLHSSLLSDQPAQRLRPPQIWHPTDTACGTGRHPHRHATTAAPAPAPAAAAPRPRALGAPQRGPRS